MLSNDEQDQYDCSTIELGRNMISKFNKDSEFYTDERCNIVEIHNHSEDENCSIARARVAPGVATQLHALNGIEERYIILSGEGRVEVGDDVISTVGTLDVVVIPDGVSQKITNISEHTDLIFLCVCTPRFRVEAYVKMDD